MDHELRRLKRLLRDEKCPDRVLANIRKELLRGRQTRDIQMSLRTVALCAAAVGLLVLAVFFRAPAPAPERSAVRAPAESADHAQVALETQVSLAYIGYALIEAGNSTENIVKEQTAPILRKLKQSLSKPIYE